MAVAYWLKLALVAGRLCSRTAERTEFKSDIRSLTSV